MQTVHGGLPPVPDSPLLEPGEEDNKNAEVAQEEKKAQKTLNRRTAGEQRAREKLAVAVDIHGGENERSLPDTAAEQVTQKPAIEEAIFAANKEAHERRSERRRGVIPSAFVEDEEAELVLHQAAVATVHQQMNRPSVARMH